MEWAYFNVWEKKMIDIRIVIYGFSWTNIGYILAIAFQLAGALLLIFHYMKNPEEQIKKSYFSQDAIVEAENGKVKLRKEKVRIKAAEIYINRIAFIYIALGYFLGIFGDVQNASRLQIAFLTAMVTILLIAIGSRIQARISNDKFKDDLEIDRNELPKGVSETMSAQEFEEKF